MTLRERFQRVFRSRVGKYNSQTIGYEIGAFPFTESGAYVTDKGAMGLSAVYACVYRIASTIASLDIEVLQRNETGTQPANTHPAQNLISYSPNEYQTAPEFWETLVSYAVATGAGHAYIERDERGYGTSLRCIRPEDLEAIDTPLGEAFKTRDYGVVQAENMLCLYNLQRKSPIRLHRENLGLAASAQSYGAKWYHDGQMTGILTTDQPLRNEQMDAVRQSWRNQGGAGTRLVPHGLKYQRVSISPEEAQFIHTRRFQAEEIARIFGVPPALIQLESQTTYNNVEQQNIQYGRHTIAPWVRKIEREIDLKLIQSRERPQTFSRFDLDGLYRGDIATRTEFYEAMVRLGAFSLNEVRAKEGLNPIPGGNQHMVPVNSISLEQFDQYSRKISGQTEQPNELQQLPESDD